MKEGMNSLVFTQRVLDETACKEHYSDMRSMQGLICKKYGIASEVAALPEYYEGRKGFIFDDRF